ncbi:MAG: hypothetical protein NZ585_04435 [Chloracidobacterium sp.]|nr:hypothetical protein [Chloracidobacterium sp.]
MSIATYSHLAERTVDDSPVWNAAGAHHLVHPCNPPPQSAQAGDKLPSPTDRAGGRTALHRVGLFA